MPASPGSPYVLVHGAYHGGWCWEAVARELPSRRIFAPTLTGLSERRNEYARTVDLDRHVEDVVELIEREALHSVHLVGWSYGGMVTTGVLCRVPSRVAAITYLDAYLPADRQSVATFLPARERVLLSVASLLGVGLDPPDPRKWGVRDEQLLSVLSERLSPQPPRTLTQPVHAPEPWPAHVAYSYVWFRGYAGSVFGRFRDRASEDARFRVVELRSSHASPLTHPKAVADVLSA